MLDDNKSTANSLIATAHDMIPRLRERAQICEDNGRVPEETIQELLELRFFDITKPKRYGGLELGWDVFGEVVMKISTGCGSTGWVYSVLAQHAMLANRIGISFMDEAWGQNPNALFAATKFQKGRVRKVADGYIASGISTFGSGCLHSDWIVVGGAAVEDSNEIITAMVPVEDIKILDTWHANGLGGTGSNHIEMEEVFIPSHRVRVPGKTPAGGIIDAPLYRTTGLGVPFGLSTVLVGMAQNAIELFTDSIKGRKSRDGHMLGDLQSLQMRVGESAAEIVAARCLIRSHLTELMAVLEGLPPPTGAGGYEQGKWPEYTGQGFSDGQWPAAGTGDDSPHLGLANAFAAQLAHSAIERLSYAAGASQMNIKDPLLRCLRDCTAGTRQFGLNWDVARTRAGRSFLEQT